MSSHAIDRREALVSTALLALALGLLPLSVSLNALGVALLLLSWLAHRLVRRDLGQRWAALRARPTAALALLAPVAYVAWATLSLLWTTDCPHGWQDVRTFAPLAIVPLVVGLGPRLSAPQRGVVMGAFVLGTLLTIALALIAAAGRPGGSERFFYQALLTGRDLHVIFLAHYAAVGLVLTVGNLDLVSSRAARAALMVVALLLTGSLMLLASRMTLAAVAAVAFVALLSTRRFTPRQKAVGVALALVLGVLAFRLAPARLTQRFADLTTRGWDYALVNPTIEWPQMPNEFAMRVVAWRVAVSRLDTPAAWLGGVGSGDAQDQMGWGWFHARLWMYYRYHNAHSQYVQALLALGVVGLTLLLVGLVAALRAADDGSRSGRVAMLALLLIALTWLTESALVRQHGVMLWALAMSTLALSRSLGQPHSAPQQAPGQ